MKQLKSWIAILTLALSPSLYSLPSSATEDQASTAQEVQLSQAELAQLLAPIALYPDSLLSHILIASTYPLEVVQADRWRKQHASLSAAQAVNLAADQDWDPSVIALVGFETVLAKLSEDLTWTQKLGDAFLQDEASVLASIQTLRAEADAADSLSKMDNMRVSRVNNSIIIEPIQQQIVYVPVYDSRLVYGSWRWHQYPPVYWTYPVGMSVSYYGPGARLFFWHAGIHIGFNYYFSAFRWHERHIIVTHHRHTSHYRPYRKIVASHGAKRWAHKPQHRHGVAYSTHKVKQRYNSYRPTQSQLKQQRQLSRTQLQQGQNRGSSHQDKVLKGQYIKPKYSHNGAQSKALTSRLNATAKQRKEPKAQQRTQHAQNAKSATLKRNDDRQYVQNNSQGKHRATDLSNAKRQANKPQSNQRHPNLQAQTRSATRASAPKSHQRARQASNYRIKQREH
ncbi:DUF3300 domain-containing protein [Shewanella sp. AS1]|uniref:DUF3300 domain-containing protein n=1 Tax=Shewanella sp. AS1 TaxID=2907626 RepID=UPI001F3B6D7F|nr:DUF3300 domain-containing protein [Shewanella sp. AS1]MCE9678128.1 DUF3300 domain-containing protein [Shewanella sp. AS1]